MTTINQHDQDAADRAAAADLSIQGQAERASCQAIEHAANGDHTAAAASLAAAFSAAARAGERAADSEAANQAWIAAWDNASNAAVLIASGEAS